VFLNVLRDDLVRGRWAKGYLQRLATDPDLKGDEEIQRIRRLMIGEDDLHLTGTFHFGRGVSISSNALLLDLLKQNGENQMAFEYLMAVCLQNDDVQTAAEMFSFLDNFSYPQIPPPYEEAALVCLSEFPEHAKNIARRGSKFFLRGRQISEATINKFHHLQAIVAPFGGINEKSRAAVQSELGDSYLYYFYYASKTHL
jgi:hypothetical protein